MEIEFAYPFQNRISTPDSYFFFYLMPGKDYSFAIAYPFDGFHELIEQILSEDVYQAAFRQEWPIFNNLAIKDQQKMSLEFTKRPILSIFCDPEDEYKEKWVVATAVAVPVGASNVVTHAELKGLESLIFPSLSLLAEAKDAITRVMIGQIEGRYKFAKSRFEKFIESFNKAEPFIGKILDVLQSASGK